jgi:hypothetical protein
MPYGTPTTHFGRGFGLEVQNFVETFSCLTISFKTTSMCKSYDQSITPEQQLNSQVCVVIVFFLLKEGTILMEPTKGKKVGNNNLGTTRNKWTR